MVYLIVSAWVMGFIGSAHCIGMCGPLALALPVKSETTTNRIFLSLVYNGGRILTYTLYGSLLGLTQSLLVPFFFQSQLSVSIGIMLLLLSVYFLFFKNKQIRFGTNNVFYAWITNKMSAIFSKGTPKSIFLIGMLNGLLPCGLVYLALATAFATGAVYKSVLFMSFFGLGTLPAMWSVVFFTNYITPSFRASLRRLYPFVYAITGILLIVRGLKDYSFVHHLMQGVNVFCN